MFLRVNKNIFALLDGFNFVAKKPSPDTDLCEDLNCIFSLEVEKIGCLPKLGKECSFVQFSTIWTLYVSLMKILPHTK